MNRTALSALPLSHISIDDAYWNRYIRLIPAVVLPYQWSILNDKVPDAPPSHCLQNFRIAAGETQGERWGTVFLDSDAAKWLEAVAYSLASHPDEALEATADAVIALIGRAQCPDGYLNTYYTLVEPENRWKNLAEGHELYVAGHMIEAAVAYADVTGKKAFLDIVCRNADLICDVFGPAKHQLHGYPGHSEIELALVRLYHATRRRRYLELARYFIDMHGQQPNYFLEEQKQPGFKHLFPEFRYYDPLYSQSHLPVRQQKTAEGHAVRAVYLYCAMADLAQEYQDEALLQSCKTLWNNLTRKRMYVTGSIGSSGFWERFTTDYDLPNASNYSETCASIGLALFGMRMARITRDASYMEVVERALYNNIRAGMSLRGNTYFYVNPLEVWPERCLAHTSDEHVKPVRQKWFDVACCPTNMARTFTALGQYLYGAGPSDLFLNLWIRNRTQLSLGGEAVCFTVETDFPRTGKISLQIKTAPVRFALHLRIPSYAEDVTVLLNGTPADGVMENGYYVLDRVWRQDAIALSFSMVPKFVFAPSDVRADSAKLALMRGPEVYCLEETDNGANLSSICVKPDTPIQEEWKSDLLGGTLVLHFDAVRLTTQDPESAVSSQPPMLAPVHCTAIPYGSWCNRTPGEMLVWIHALLS